LKWRAGWAHFDEPEACNPKNAAVYNSQCSIAFSPINGVTALLAAHQLITVLILAHNEEENITHCLESIGKDYKVFVVDSGSTDRTSEICEAFGALVFRHPYTTHASQWQWALENLPITTPWVLALDADFVVTAALCAKLTQDIPKVPDDVDGIYIRHLYRFGWGTIRFGGTKRYWLRIIRHGFASPDSSDLVDFRFVVKRRVVVWQESVIEYNRKDDDISVWIGKQDKFALRLAVEEELRRRGLHAWDGAPRLLGTTDERFAWLRDRWLRLPLFLRPVLYFVYRYMIAGGMWDGRAGFLYHVLQGFWLRLIVDWKTTQLRNVGLKDDELREFGRAMLQTRSGSVDEVLQVLQECLSQPGERHKISTTRKS
jgi:glycosyltransferase involved in cell wall biosynthesis